MIGRRFGWEPGYPAVRRDDALRSLPWIVAVLAYLAGLCGFGLVVVQGSVHAAERALTTALTLQVPAETSNARLETVLAVLRQTKGIASARPLEPAETARLLEPWLGPKVPIDALPVPRLIDLRLDPAGGPDLAALQHQIASVVPEARLDDRREWLGGVRSAATRVAVTLSAAIVAALALVAATSIFGVRAGLMIDRQAIEVLHLLGTPDTELARQFAIRCLQLGLVGGVIGAAALALTVLALGDAGSLVQLPAPTNARGIGDWRFWLILIAVIGTSGLIAMASAGLVVLRWLARLP